MILFQDIKEDIRRRPPTHTHTHKHIDSTEIMPRSRLNDRRPPLALCIYSDRRSGRRTKCLKRLNSGYAESNPPHVVGYCFVLKLLLYFRFSGFSGCVGQLCESWCCSDGDVRTRTAFIIYGERERLMQGLLMCCTFGIRAVCLCVCVCLWKPVVPTDASCSYVLKFSN